MTDDEIYMGLLHLTNLGKLDWKVGGSRTMPRYTAELWTEDGEGEVVEITVMFLGERPAMTCVHLRAGDTPEQLGLKFTVREARLPQAIVDQIGNGEHEAAIARDAISRALERLALAPAT